MIRIYKELRSLGLKGTIWRVSFELKRRFGVSALIHAERPVADYKAIVKKKRTLDDIDFDLLFVGDGKFANLEELIHPREQKDVLGEADDILSLKFERFGCEVAEYEKLEWCYEPESKVYWPSDMASSKVLTCLDKYGDIKLLWELARFSWLMVLARAYSITQNEKYILFGIETIIDFGEKNPLNLGVHWCSEQEVAIRVYNIIWFWSYCRKNISLSLEDETSLAAMVLMHHEYLEKHMDYAIFAIRNNHLIHGLIAALLTSEFLRVNDGAMVDRWAEELYISLKEQWYDDGGYVQPSFIYHRSALYGLIFLLQFTEKKDKYRKLNNCVREIFARSLDFLKPFVCAEGGSVPNWGPNDGSRIFKMSNSDYGDFRPLINIMESILGKQPSFNSAACKEEVYWFMGRISKNTPASSKVAENKAYFSDQGLASIHVGGGASILFRCGDIRNRYALQADQLHVDLQWHGYRVFVDSGSFNYNKDIGLHNYYRGTSSHNTVTVNDFSQMEPYRKFKFLDWTKSVFCKTVPEFNENLLGVGCHNGYLRLPEKLNHCRFIFKGSDGSLVFVDRVWSVLKKNVEKVSLRWNFNLEDAELNETDCSFSSKKGFSGYVTCNKPVKANFKSAGEDKRRGWVSPSYNCLRPVWSMEFNAGIESDVTFITVLIDKEKMLVKDFAKTLEEQKISEKKLVEVSRRLGDKLVEVSK